MYMSARYTSKAVFDNDTQPVSTEPSTAQTIYSTVL